MHNSTFEWDDVLALGVYYFNVAPLVNNFESPFYLVQGSELFKGRLSHLQKYCRYVGEQPGRLVVQELRNVWKTHAKLL